MTSSVEFPLMVTVQTGIRVRDTLGVTLRCLLDVGKPKDWGMNWDQISDNWKQVIDRIKQRWGRLTDADLTEVAGQREVLMGKIQQRYGVVKEEAERQVGIWEEKVSSAFDALDKATSKKTPH